MDNRLNVISGEVRQEKDRVTAGLQDRMTFFLSD